MLIYPIALDYYPLKPIIDYSQIPNQHIVICPNILKIPRALLPNLDMLLDYREFLILLQMSPH